MEDTSETFAPISVDPRATIDPTNLQIEQMNRKFGYASLKVVRHLGSKQIVPGSNPGVIVFLNLELEV